MCIKIFWMHIVFIFIESFLVLQECSKHPLNTQLSNFLVQKYAICALSCDKMQTNQQSRYRQIWWCQSFLNHKIWTFSNLCTSLLKQRKGVCVYVVCKVNICLFVTCMSLLRLSNCLRKCVNSSKKMCLCIVGCTSKICQKSVQLAVVAVSLLNQKI